MRGLKSSEVEKFKKFLGGENKNELEQAMKYYDKVLNAKMDWPNDKKEDVDNEGEEITGEELPTETVQGEEVKSE